MAHATQCSRQVLKCFCNCTILTEDEIENILLATIDGFLSNDLGKKLFRSFLKIGRTNNASDYPPVLEALDCYELSNKVNHGTELNESVYDELICLCPSFELEESLTEAYEKGDGQLVTNAITTIMCECKLIIEESREYTAYRKKLCDKIKNHRNK